MSDAPTSTDTTDPAVDDIEQVDLPSASEVDLDDAVFNRAGTHVWMRHPDFEDPWESPLSYVPIALMRGWEFTGDPAAPVALLDDLTAQLAARAAESTAAPADGQPTGFDPARHTVKEIDAHLAAYAQDAPGEVARVMEVERAGQDRTSITNPLDTTDRTTA